MPKYGYKCPECALRWEAWGGMKDIPPLCPSCGGAHGERAPSTVFFVNKGAKNEKVQKIGEITKEHIEENREILEKMKEMAKKEEE